MDAIFLNACKNNQKAIVQTLLKKGGINLDKRDAMGNTALYYSCQKGARDIAKILIDGGADVNLANNQSITPLHMVSQSGNKEIATVLLASGADINATDKEGKTVLIYSLAEG
ncbi:ankyrin repeat domain-containing protein [Pedobacter sp. SL55]|uniref:ankyrin repeat domain-containing protein n=1 Tax=Pedobacter sp. SL55 TaxID=2995161 RepID=UPI00226DB12A|nr:ankyrin repeat domain-containing protein [Pedobacter sp. SL55]WAC39439.1 ankyrin repeat domain-containing protein [Pedobacter sp. SL55]